MQVARRFGKNSGCFKTRGCEEAVRVAGQEESRLTRKCALLFSFSHGMSQGYGINEIRVIDLV